MGSGEVQATGKIVIERFDGSKEKGPDEYQYGDECTKDRTLLFCLPFGHGFN
jgi:hypothetical protein